MHKTTLSLVVNVKANHARVWESVGKCHNFGKLLHLWQKNGYLLPEF